MKHPLAFPYPTTPPSQPVSEQWFQHTRWSWHPPKSAMLHPQSINSNPIHSWDIPIQKIGCKSTLLSQSKHSLLESTESFIFPNNNYQNEFPTISLRVHAKINKTAGTALLASIPTYLRGWGRKMINLRPIWEIWQEFVSIIQKIKARGIAKRSNLA